MSLQQPGQVTSTCMVASRLRAVGASLIAAALLAGCSGAGAESSGAADTLVLQSGFAILLVDPAGNAYGHRMIIGGCVDS
ncbi:hypothetical protein QFZ82_000385 [Streptomyces sp. V4I23]|nr:hypothetical protein [Streptomyces sp. V4I23]